MPQKINWILLIILCSSAFLFWIWRDMELEKQYTGDLRNRIVGARLQKDGQSPYFINGNLQIVFVIMTPKILIH